MYLLFAYMKHVVHFRFHVTDFWLHHICTFGGGMGVGDGGGGLRTWGGTGLPKPFCRFRERLSKLAAGAVCRGRGAATNEYFSIKINKYWVLRTARKKV